MFSSDHPSSETGAEGKKIYGTAQGRPEAQSERRPADWHVCLGQAK